MLQLGQVPCSFGHNPGELNNIIFGLIHINSQENMLLKSIEKFYININNITEFLDIINSQSSISIRLIDYFITKYSKKNKISYKMDDSSMFNIYQSYKLQLKAYQKKNFDPFARGIRIPYFIDNTCLITTIGQLNFFKWFISKNILTYVIINKDNIEQDLNNNKKNINDSKIKKSHKTYKKNNIKLKNIQSVNIQAKVKNNILVTF